MEVARVFDALEEINPPVFVAGSQRQSYVRFLDIPIEERPIRLTDSGDVIKAWCFDNVYCEGMRWDDAFYLSALIEACPMGPGSDEVEMLPFEFIYFLEIQDNWVGG